jgi:hypothetical protein
MNLSSGDAWRTPLVDWTETTSQKEAGQKKNERSHFSSAASTLRRNTGQAAKVEADGENL